MNGVSDVGVGSLFFCSAEKESKGRKNAQEEWQTLLYVVRAKKRTEITTGKPRRLQSIGRDLSVRKKKKFARVGKKRKGIKNKKTEASASQER